MILQNDYIHGGTQKDFYTPEEVEFRNCPLCDKNDYAEIYKERGNLGIVKCNNCEFIYANPKAKGSQENYFGDSSAFFQEARLIFVGKNVHHRDKNYEYEIQKIKLFKPSGKLLDIGTNMGFFLRKAKQAGFETEGVEPSPSLSEIARKYFQLNIHTDFLQNVNLPENNYDVITMIDVFEHVDNPIDMLNSVKRLLKNDGILCVKVPNGNYNVLKLKLARLLHREQQHDLFDSYEHVSHFSIKTMRKLLNQNGFEIIKVIIPIPIHPPVWAPLTGHYFQYPSPAILDWKKRAGRKLFWMIGKLELMFGCKVSFAPDLMFIIKKK